VETCKESKQLTPGCLVRLKSGWGQYKAVYRKNFNYDRAYIYSTDILIYIKRDKSCFSFSSEQVDVFFCLRSQKFIEASRGVFEPLDEEEEEK
jgi:hypothetical protein